MRRNVGGKRSLQGECCAYLLLFFYALCSNFYWKLRIMMGMMILYIYEQDNSGATQIFWCGRQSLTNLAWPTNQEKCIYIIYKYQGVFKCRFTWSEDKLIFCTESYMVTEILRKILRFLFLMKHPVFLNDASLKFFWYAGRLLINLTWSDRSIQTSALV